MAPTGSVKGGKDRYPIKKYLGWLLVLVVPGLLALGYLYQLHVWQPRVKTPTVINRNSLLPHRFSGVCENCHAVTDVGLTAINRNTAPLLNLTLTQRRLVEAGQEVAVPTLAQMVRTPAILRADVLSHRYLGVCSNCHLILDVRPTPNYKRQAMQRASESLVWGRPMSKERIARGGVRERHTREIFRNIFGVLSLFLFVASTVYVAMRVALQSNPRLKGKLPIKRWFTVHEWSSIGLFLAALLHWYFSDRGNNLLHISLVLICWLTVAGLALRHRLAQGTLNKKVRLLHTQRYVFAILIGLLVLGHFVAGFE